jgi:menaquinone-dependent protoporphyrinogen oxidase
MSEILIAYTTNAGSTPEVAQAVAEELVQRGFSVTLNTIAEVKNISAYDGVIVGAPMILGWHGSAKKFLRKFRKELSTKKCAYFCTAISITKDETDKIQNVPVYLDPFSAKAPKDTGKMSIHEKYALPENYVKPILKQAPDVLPLSIALLGGKLDMGKLNIFQMIFVMAIIRAQPGDYRNWDAIRQWAATLKF